MHNDHIVLSPDGSRFLIANYHSDSIIAIDARSLREAFRIEGLSAPHVIKYGPREERAYVTCKKITGIGIVDPGARSRVAFHQINVNPRSLTFNQDESRVFGSFWVDGVFEMETASGRLLDQLEEIEGERDRLDDVLVGLVVPVASHELHGSGAGERPAAQGGAVTVLLHDPRGAVRTRLAQPAQREARRMQR